MYGNVVDSKQGLNLHLATDAEHCRHCESTIEMWGRTSNPHCSTAAMFVVRSRDARISWEQRICREHARGAGWLLNLSDTSAKVVAS